MPSTFVQDNEYVLMTMNLKKKMKMGNAENEKEFEILIHSDLPIAIVIE